MIKLRKKGQSTVEYVVLVAAVLAILIWFLTSANSPFRAAYNTALRTGSDGMEAIASSLNQSHGTP
jgi:uncharacterized protein (UPF0333 family)